MNEILIWPCLNVNFATGFEVVRSFVSFVLLSIFNTYTVGMIVGIFIIMIPLCLVCLVIISFFNNIIGYSKLSEEEKKRRAHDTAMEFFE